MKVLQPAIFPLSSLDSFAWSKGKHGLELLDYLLTVGRGYSSLLLGYSAHPGNNVLKKTIAEEIAKTGLNVFASTVPVPLSALSLALVQKNMPMGLYLSETTPGSLSLLALAAHGGPADLEERRTPGPPSLNRTGILGETEMLSPYLKELSGLLDPFPEGGPRLASLDSPFFLIEQFMEKSQEFQILRQREERGPRAFIDFEGQALRVEMADGHKLTTPEIVQTIGKYLIEGRCSSGSIVGPPGTAKLTDGWAPALEVSGNSVDMSHRAIFSDLLLGWWEPGIIAHQGHSPFGDAYLSLAYLLEAWAQG